MEIGDKPFFQAWSCAPALTCGALPGVFFLQSLALRFNLKSRAAAVTVKDSGAGHEQNETITSAVLANRWGY
jgi:hypothetical protein